MPYKSREKERARCRAYYARNREAIKNQQRAYRLASPPKSSTTSPAARRAYYEANRDSIRAKQQLYWKRYYAANHEKRVAASQRYRDEHPGHNAEYRRQRRARDPAFQAREIEDANRREAMRRGATTEKVDRLYVIARDEGICHLCGTPVPESQIELDHVIPLSRGGAHNHANLRVAHRSCNRRRGARLLNEMQG